MKPNLGWLDRSLRFTLGVFLLIWAIAGGPFWTWLGSLALASAAWSFCPVYSLLKISSRRDSSL